MELGFYRNILREHGRVNQPKLTRDIAIKRRILQVLESSARGIGRLEAVLERIDPNTMEALLAKRGFRLSARLQVSTPQHVVGLEELASRHSSSLSL